MINFDGFTFEKAKDVTFSTWKQWLYKSLFHQSRLDLGIVELTTGRADRIDHGNETINYYVIDGYGRFFMEDEPHPFKAGTFIRIAAGQHYGIECAESSRFLALRTENRSPQIDAHPIAPGQTIPDRMLDQPQAIAQFRFVIDGELQLKYGDGKSIPLPAGTAIHLDPQIRPRYVLVNKTTTPAHIAVASAGEYQPAPTASNAR
jgi:quercetin dioxygenase-like cupin family protein